MRIFTAWQAGAHLRPHRRFQDESRERDSQAAPLRTCKLRGFVCALRLFLAEGLHGVYQGGAAGWDEAGQERG